MTTYKTLQDQTELDALIAFIKTEGVSSYLEIGSKYGGSLWHIANSLPKGSKIVSVDLPNADKLMKESLTSLRRCVSELLGAGFQSELIVGDSTDASVVEQVRVHAPFDLCLIDGGHTEQIVRSDWENYGAMAKVIAFHDIAWPVDKPTQPNGQWCHVGTVWREIKGSHRSTEIVRNPSCYGFGILWR